MAQLNRAFGHLPPTLTPLDNPASREAMAAVLSQVADRLADNYPYFHPLYAGQMLKRPTPSPAPPTRSP